MYCTLLVYTEFQAGTFHHEPVIWSLHFFCPMIHPPIWGEDPFNSILVGFSNWKAFVFFNMEKTEQSFRCQVGADYKKANRPENQVQPAFNQYVDRFFWWGHFWNDTEEQMEKTQDLQGTSLQCLRETWRQTGLSTTCHAHQWALVLRMAASFPLHAHDGMPNKNVFGQ